MAQPRVDSLQLAVDSFGSTCPRRCHASFAYEALDNGFFACDDPDALQVICDGFGVAHLEAFFRSSSVDYRTRSQPRIARPIGYELSIFQRLDPHLPEDSPGTLRRARRACENELDTS